VGSSVDEEEERDKDVDWISGQADDFIHRELALAEWAGRRPVGLCDPDAAIVAVVVHAGQPHYLNLVAHNQAHVRSRVDPCDLFDIHSSQRVASARK